jgi:hypothetical protein
MARSIYVTCATLCLAGIFACSLEPLPPEERLVEQAFKAIRDNDWQEYSKMTITTADIMLRNSRISPIEERQSYLGTSLRPQQRALQQEQFRRAVRGGPIDFRNAKFVSVGADERHFVYELLLGGAIPVSSYSLRVEIEGQEIESEEPRIIVVKWNGQPRILGLSFHDS